ncbi:MAG: small subunit ribosomal protein S8 [Candidatus Berkelbacteria bacterium Licking1014_2]|uniref:Small ribosomal subunit protein uS8 n=1 Tax=Candidatus Berkelbacteria bacterium Licking1014_2 TaxID=2017146 RepID=A0A554LWZ3_9BACT|nr:MAG: small subunit ribosomal protein S8 [Candidatus Berkelbacteria bacterium Licking1014_2]
MDTIANLLNTIKNSYSAGKSEAIVLDAKINQEILKILQANGYIKDWEKKSEKEIVVRLQYHQKKPAISYLKRVSTPGRRVYCQKKDISRLSGRLGITIISTPKGILNNREAVKAGLGGEVICQLW